MFRRFKCIAVDDDKSYLTVIKAYILKTNSLELCGLFSNAIEAINFLNSNTIEIIFLDVQMPQMSGLDIIESLNSTPQIILVSSSEEHALQAIKYNVTDYIIKQENDYARFIKATNRAIQNVKKEKNGYLFLKIDKRLVKLSFKDIIYIEAYGDYVKIHTDKSTLLKLTSLRSLQMQLPENDFVKVHRSFIVRLDKIELVEGNCILFNNKEIPISKQYRNELYSLLKMY